MGTAYDALEWTVSLRTPWLFEKEVEKIAANPTNPDPLSSLAHTGTVTAEFTDSAFPPHPSSIDGRNKRTRGSSSSSYEKPPKCNCMIDARAKRVYKEGPNQGRYFYGCTKPAAHRCKYFKWARGEPHTKEALSSQWLRFRSPQFCLSSKAKGIDAAGGKNRRMMLAFSPRDIIQGGVGDCWFISAAAVVAERQDLISRVFSKHLFHATIPGTGKLELQLCIHGKWTNIAVDTLLPVKPVESTASTNQRFLLEEFGTQFGAAYAKPGPGSSLWVAYLEKAYAKACGSYQAISGGEIVEAMSVLCGCPTEVISLNDSTFDSEIVWARLLSFLSSGFPMGCGTASNGEGVVGCHAYSILDVKEVAGVRPSRQRTMKEFFGKNSCESAKASSEHLSHEGTLRVMKIRNPWGKKEWNGAFGAKSEVWSQELRDLLGQSDKNDGTFWMTYQDFQRRFVNIDVAKSHKDWYEVDFDVCDADRETKGILSPTVVSFRVMEPTWLQVCLFMPNKRGKLADYADAALMIVKQDARDQRSVLHLITSTRCRCENIEFVADDATATYELLFLSKEGELGDNFGGYVLPNHVFRIFSAKPIFSTMTSVVEDHWQLTEVVKYMYA